MKARIGITWKAFGEGGDPGPAAGYYLQSIIDAGGEPLLLLPSVTEPPVATLGRLDGLLLAGGVDVDPREYRQTPHPLLGEVDAARDALELPLARAALRQGMPVLGICRGIQVMNVAAGGTLWQDVSLAGADPARHATTEPRWAVAHRVILEGSSVTAGAARAREAGVNTFHHQTVAEVAPGFTVTGTSDDGLIESIEAPGNGFAVGVQWHPERMVSHHAHARRLFEAFLSAVRRSRP